MASPAQPQILDDKSQKKIIQKADFEKRAMVSREKYRQHAFMLMLEIAAIIAIPAFTALVIGKKINNNGYLLPLIALAFVISWTIVIIKYIRFNKRVKQVDARIKKEKEAIERWH